MLDGAKVGINVTPPFPPLLFKKQQVLSAQVLALFSTPVILVPAQSDKAIILEQVHIHKPAGTAYANGTNLVIRNTGSAATQFSLSVTGFLDQTAKKTGFGAIPTNASWNFDVNTMTGVGLEIAVTGANPITGNSDLFVAITYRIWDNGPNPWF